MFLHEDFLDLFPESKKLSERLCVVFVKKNLSHTL